MRRNVPKVLVVVTDGRSQDDVKKSAEKLQHSGMCGTFNHCHVWFGLHCVYSTYVHYSSRNVLNYPNLLGNLDFLHTCQHLWQI